MVNGFYLQGEKTLGEEIKVDKKSKRTRKFRKQRCASCGRKALKSQHQCSGKTKEEKRKENE